MNNRYTKYFILLLVITAGVFLVLANWKTSKITLTNSHEHHEHEHAQFSETEFKLAISEDIADLGFDIKKDFPIETGSDIEHLYTLIDKTIDAGLPSVAALYHEQLYSINQNDSFRLQAIRYLIVASKFTKEESRGSIYLLKSLELINKMLDKNPNNIDVKVLQGYALVRSEPAPMKGIGVLLEVLETNPENLDALYMLGDFSVESGQYEKAIERFKKLLSLRPLNPEYHFKLSEVFSRMSQKDSAEFYLNRGVELRKNKENIEQ